MGGFGRNGPFAVPNTIASGRVAMAIGDVHLNTMNANRGAQPLTVIEALKNDAVTDEFISNLWHDANNRDVVEAFMQNDFIWYAAQHADQEVLPYYQAYGIQDYFYLVDYVRFKALRLNTVLEDDWDTLQQEAAGLAEDAMWAVNWRKTLITELQVPPTDLDKAERSIGEMAYASVLQRHASVDDWFDLHVIMIPCLWGWTKLARMIEEDPRTKKCEGKATIFYRTWVKPNLDTSSAKKLSGFLDANKEIWGAGIDKGQGTKSGKWNQLFRTTLKLEVALFNSSGFQART